MFNKETEFDSTKFIILLSVVCIVFFVIVVKAFEYIPKDASVLPQEEYNISTSNKQQQEEKSKEDTEEYTSDEDENSDNDDESSNNVNTLLSQDNDFAEIDAPPGVNPAVNAGNGENISSNDSGNISEDNEVKVIKSLINAKKLKNDKNYSEAINEYQKVLDNTDDKEIIAECYEGMSAIYAVNKKNGTALSFALKAYNTSPNSSRALLSAQMYYKTGDTERATKIVNKLLQEEIK